MRQYARVLIRVAATHVVPYAGGGVRVHKLPNGVAIQEQHRFTVSIAASVPGK